MEDASVDALALAAMADADLPEALESLSHEVGKIDSFIQAAIALI